MKAKRYTQEQIIGFLKAHEVGVKVAELIREHGFSEQSFYRLKAKYGGMEVSEAKRLRELESENARLKKLLEGRTRQSDACRTSCQKSGEAGESQASGRLSAGTLRCQRAVRRLALFRLAVRRFATRPWKSQRMQS
jgi:putative transposase